MTIAEVSKKYDISADTLRYYERIGLLPPVPRNKSGIRDYDEASCGWIELMKCMRAAGVQIEALIEYVALFQQGDSTINAMMRMKELWAYLIRLFRDSGPYAKRLRKARDPQTFSQAVDAVFQELELLPEADWGD